MKKSSSKKMILIALGTLLIMFTLPTPSAFSETTNQLEFNVVAEGSGLIIWGFSWMPPYPGESFYLGGPGPDPPIVPIPLFNWGSPEYSAKLTNSVFKIIGDSNLDEAPVRTDSPEALPTDLTKFWLVNQNSTGVLIASWREGENLHQLEINLTGFNSGGVWVGPPATCPWGHLALGFISPSLPVQPVTFTGELDGNPIEGRMHVISWSDTMMLNLWIDDGEGGTYVNMIWVDPDEYITNEWLTYWLSYEIQLPEFGYGTEDDPLISWVPPADILCREIVVGDYVTIQSNARYWSDDFNDGDYDGWTITGYNFVPFYADMMTPPIPITGNYSIQNGVLLSEGPRVPGLAGVASHPSTVAYGSWSFDLHITDETEEHFYVYFATDDWSDYPIHINSYDIAIVLKPGQAWSWELEEDAQSGFVLIKRNGAALEGGWQALGSYSMYEELSGMYHIDITRDQDGYFKVYIDSELVIEAYDNEHTTSTWFRFTGEPGPAIDNIVVKDTLDSLAMNLGEKVTSLQNQVTETLEENTVLEGEKQELISDKETLQGNIVTNEETINTLEGQISSMEASISSMQIYVLAALVIGLAIGTIFMYLKYR